jgi:type IV pilus assembly protein PilV
MKMVSARRVHGFSMIELLVAVLVLGIGVLGITGLQVLSLQQNRSALLHGEAVHLAYDIVDRVRANPTGNYGLAWDDAPPAAQDCTASVCTVDQMRAFDEAIWKCSLGIFNTHAICETFRSNGIVAPATEQPGLPSGDGALAINGDVLVVSVRWQDANNANPTTIAVETQF